MEKLTLHFESFSDLTKFSKILTGGYLINTNNLTITGKIPSLQVSVARELYNATIIETSEKVYSYDLLK